MSASGSALSRVRGEVARRLARWAPRRRWPFGPRPAQGASGAQLGAAAAEPPRSRRDKLLCGLKLDGLGLEIGPSHAPVAPKREGFNVHVVDHLPAEELRRKYVGHDVDLDAIEAVDFIWRGEPLDATVGAVERYDWIIASHVIEHVPDVIGFLCSCEALLKDGGVLSLAVPDKRYCFDLFRWPSSTGDALQAHTERRRRHAPAAVFDHVANAAKRGGKICWDRQERHAPELLHSLEQAAGAFRSAVETDKYHDVHGWRFTPASFRLIVHDLRALGLIGLRERPAFEPEGCEFYAAFEKTTDAVAAEMDRAQLAMAMLREMGDWLAEEAAAP